jgi:alkylhydroperoxidase/carboxymuconolactone decarboxylase family protein YurZ
MTTPSATRHRIDIAPAEEIDRLDREAPPILRRHFELIRQGLRHIPGLPPDAARIEDAPTLRALALKPDIYYAWFLTEYHSAKEGEVDSATKELLAIAASARNERDENVLCTPYHAGAARFEGADESAVAIAQDFDRRKGELPERARVIVEFGLKSAYQPTEVTAEDVARVRALGLSDAALVEIVSTALIAHNLSALNQVFDLTL